MNYMAANIRSSQIELKLELSFISAITKGHVTLKGISFKYLGAFLDKIQEAELPLEISDDSITSYLIKVV